MERSSIIEEETPVMAAREESRSVGAWRWITAVTVLSLILAACGSGESTDSTVGGVTTTAPTTGSTDAPGMTTTTAAAESDVLAPLASGFPDSPITLWATFAAGHPDDLLNRKVAEIAADYSPVRIIADTAEEVGPGLSYAFNDSLLPTLPRAAEGYQIYVSNFAAMAIRPYSVEAVAESDIDDLNEIIGLQQNVFGYAVLKDSEFQTLEDVVQFAKDNPGQLRYVAGGAGSRGALQMIVWSDEAGIDATFIPTESVAESSQVMLGEGAELFGSGLHSMDLETYRVLAVTGSERNSVIPDTPTMDELGYTNPLQLSDAYTLSGYGSLEEVPAENQQWIADLMTKIVNDPRFAEEYPYSINRVISVDEIHAAEQANIDVLFPILEELGLNVRDR
jgi:putative tricarboxylic transport membrane protein